MNNMPLFVSCVIMMSVSCGMAMGAVVNTKKLFNMITEQRKQIDDIKRELEELKQRQ